MDGDGRIAQHCFRARGGDDEVFFRGGDRVAEVPQVADALVVNDFEVADGGKTARAPVDHVTSAINQAVAIEAQESFEHGAIERGFQSETLSRPIARSTQANHLFLDDAAAFRFPFPDAAFEFLAAEILALDAVLGEHAFHDELRGDAGVVHAGEPERAFAAHAMPADEHVDLSVLQHVADVDRAGNIGRGKCDGKGAAAAIAGILGAKYFFVEPGFGPALFDFLWPVGFWYFSRIHFPKIWLRRRLQYRTRCFKERTLTVCYSSRKESINLRGGCAARQIGRIMCQRKVEMSGFSQSRNVRFHDFLQG